MQEEERQQVRQRTYFKASPIDNWEHFKNTWKAVWFSQELNEVDQQDLEAFWRKQLIKLERETEKFSILVPTMVNKAQRKTEEKQKDDKKVMENTDKKQVKQVQKSKEGQKRQENIGKNSKKGAQKKPNNQVKLNQRVPLKAIDLIKREFENIEYVYQSLFMGNDKQLLIYRSCSSMNRYLERYRLPVHFKPKLDDFNHLIDELYEKKLKSNIAISTFSIKTREELQKELSILKDKFQKYLQDFKRYFQPILQDFNQNTKAIIMTIQVRHEMFDFLQEMTAKKELKMSNKYFQTDFDEIRDIIIEKKASYEQRKREDAPTVEVKQQQVQRYIYVDAPKLPEAPKDIYSAKLIEKNLKNQSWTWRIFLPTCSKYNEFKGLYLRAPQREGPSELTIELQPPLQYIEIELFPYQIGKVSWEIYIYNDVGFTKSSEKIVFYNDLEVKGVSPPAKNHKSEVIGFSDCGIVLGDEQLKKIQKYGQISVYNAAVICDAAGTCGGWGQMYFPENEKSQQTNNQTEISLDLLQNQRIETPFLILKGQFIRKVSCGLGYTLMLSSLGVIWSFGFNGYGQLGQGHLDSNYDCTEPREISKFIGDSTSFVTDVCAESKGSSFAIDDKGKLYRWGYNQVQETFFPIYDRFGTPINFQTKETIYKNSTPLVLGKGYINGHVKTVEASNEHYFALTKEGDLYGWGVVKMLGLGVLKDTKENQIVDVVNPVEIKSQISTISTNFHHTIALTTKGRILAWGKAEHFSKKLSGFYDKPVDVTEEYLFKQGDKVRTIKAGVNYTVIVRENNSIEIIGSETLLDIKPDAYKNPIVDVTCSKFEECLVVMTDE